VDILLGVVADLVLVPQPPVEQVEAEQENQLQVVEMELTELSLLVEVEEHLIILE
tara:strand:+ start:319 stop:483 length:165 start_codon:yes stop_codon:yes gene_type:complete